jgi:methylenetetrahydrofolate dehydrogenase (NADP+)/methenyltetrahydrofolate cyclohydrolase
MGGFIKGQKLSGIKVRDGKIEYLKDLVSELQTIPVLAIIVIGDNPASKVYVKNKMEFAKKIGVDTKLFSFDNQVQEQEILDLIESLNNDTRINGLFVQLPIPKHINEKTIIKAIAQEKDVDGFSYGNIGKLFINDEEGLYPCTVEGIVQILEYYKIPVSGKNIVIAGRSNIVGKPLALRLINLGATVTVCNSKTQDIKKIIDIADVFISAIGIANHFGYEDFKDNKDLYIIDVGINRDDNGVLCGDVMYDAVIEHVNGITPVPGGVGVMTVVNVIENVIRAYIIQNNTNN